jgi:cyanophycin synthetase
MALFPFKYPTTLETAYLGGIVKAHLRRAGIPVPNGQMVSTEEDALTVFNEIRAAVVVKPDVGNHGNGSTVNITEIDQLKKAFQSAKSYYSDVIVEEYIHSFDFRLLVINGELAAAAKREPAHIIGNGESSIETLIQKTNSDPRPGFGHEKVLSRIEIDNMTKRLLSLRGFTLASISEEGEVVYLKTTANLSQEGTATDVTDLVNPEIRIMAERTARIIGLDRAGVDALPE